MTLSLFVHEFRYILRGWVVVEKVRTQTTSTSLTGAESCFDRPPKTCFLLAYICFLLSKLFKAIIPDSLRNIDVVLNKLLVYDAMVKLRIQINSKTSLKEAIDIMQNEELFTLPIVENGKIMGVITEETVFEYMLANE